MVKKVLAGHTSPETAYVVDDYPYGFRLRCKIRYWLEYRKGFGYRLMSQTTNPKNPFEVWNKPKGSTYCSLAAAMFLDGDNHVQWNGLGHYSKREEFEEFVKVFAAAIEADENMKAMFTRYFE